MKETRNRNTKKYKDLSDGEICLLQHEVDNIEYMIEKIEKNKYFTDLMYVTQEYKGTFSIQCVDSFSIEEFLGKEK